MAAGRLRRLGCRIRRARGRLVKVFSLRAYLKHEIDIDPEGEDREAIEAYLSIETQHWLKRADRVHVGVADIPTVDNESQWMQTYDGLSCLKWEPLRRLKRLVEDAEYERTRRKHEGREFLLKWFTAVFAALAALASIWNVYLTTRKR